MNNKKDGNNVNFWLPSGQGSSKAESLTPHKISTVFLVREFLALKQQLPAVLKANHKKKFYLLLLQLIQYSDLNYRELYGLLVSDDLGLHPSHLQQFEAVMTAMSSNENGIETLFDLQQDVDRLMSDAPDKNGGVLQFGIVGLYLRRVHVTLDKMTFSEVLSLYKTIKKYFESGTRMAQIGPTNSGNKLTRGKDRAACRWSIKQAELFVSQQSNLLQNDETQAMNPRDLQMKLCEIMQDNPLFSQAYFLCYMNSVRLRDYFNAMDALMRTFDRSTLKSFTANSASSDSKIYQYSSLNLAILHAQFGHREEAIQSLKECIMLSQEAGDRTALDLAQSWLNFLNANDRIATHQQDSSPAKPDMSAALNTSVAIQSVVKRASNSGASPAKLFEMLLKSDALNCQHSLQNLMSAGLAERTALWSLYGKNDVASVCSQVLLTTNIQKLGKPYNSDGICEALCTSALWMGLQSDYQLAAAILQHAKSRFPRFPMSHHWIIVDSYLTTVQCGLSGRWDEAEEAARVLSRIDRPLSVLQRASTSILRRNLKLAQKLIYDLLDEQSLEPLVEVKALILLANTLILPDDIHPEVISILNRAMTLAKDRFLSYEVAVIHAHFAHVLLHFGMPQRALKCVKAAIEPILVNGSLYDRAKVQFTFLRCIVESCSETASTLRKLNECRGLIGKAAEAFLKLESYGKAKDLYGYVARKYHECGDFETRNHFSCKFRRLHEEFPTPVELFDVFY